MLIELTREQFGRLVDTVKATADKLDRVQAAPYDELLAVLQQAGEQRWVIYDFDEREMVGGVYDTYDEAVEDADDLGNVVIRPFLTGGPSVADDYNDGACPDCGEDIPPTAVDGSECDNCGHVFAKLGPNDG